VLLFFNISDMENAEEILIDSNYQADNFKELKKS